jgi:hypothetical protein
LSCVSDGSGLYHIPTPTGLRTLPNSWVRRCEVPDKRLHALRRSREEVCELGADDSGVITR